MIIVLLVRVRNNDRNLKERAREKHPNKANRNIKTNQNPNRSTHTVVRNHINAATLAPIATAPAVPPRTALAADLLMISLNDNGWCASFSDDMICYKYKVYCFRYLYFYHYIIINISLLFFISRMNELLFVSNYEIIFGPLFHFCRLVHINHQWRRQKQTEWCKYVVVVLLVLLVQVVWISGLIEREVNDVLYNIIAFYEYSILVHSLSWKSTLQREYTTQSCTAPYRQVSELGSLNDLCEDCAPEIVVIFSFFWFTVAFCECKTTPSKKCRRDGRSNGKKTSDVRCRAMVKGTTRWAVRVTETRRPRTVRPSRWLTGAIFWWNFLTLCCNNRVSNLILYMKNIEQMEV